MSYFLAIPGQLCNISGPLRDDDFTIDLTQGEIFSVFFMTYFVIIPTKTYTSIVSTYLYPCIMKLRRKSYNLSQSSLFLDVKRTFRHTFFIASYDVCLVAIPELFEQTQGSDYWQLIHSYSMRYHFSLTWSKMLSTMTSRDSYNISFLFKLTPF